MMGLVRLLLSNAHLGPMRNGTCVPSWAVVGRTGQDLAARVDQRALKVGGQRPAGWAASAAKVPMRASHCIARRAAQWQHW